MDEKQRDEFNIGVPHYWELRDVIERYIPVGPGSNDKITMCISDLTHLFNMELKRNG